MTAPAYGLLGGIDPSQIPLATQDPNAPPAMAPAPYAHQPSIVDRLAARLFPGAAYQGLLSPAVGAGLQRQSLANVGLNLINASGASPYQRGLLPNLAASIQQSQMRFPEMADQALRFQVYRSQMARSAAIQQMAAQTGTDPVAMIRQLTPLFADNPEALEKLGAAAKSLGGEDSNLQEVKGIIDTRLGSPTATMRGTGLVNKKGQLVQFYPEGQEPKKITPTDVLAYSKDFETAIANHALAKQSYDTYQANQADTGATVDQTRLAAAINIVLPGSHMTGAQLSDPAVASSLKGTFLGPIVAALDPKTGTLPPAERKSLDAIVGNAVMLRKHESATITAQRRRLAQSQGINPDSYAIDPWAPGGPASARPPLNFK